MADDIKIDDLPTAPDVDFTERVPMVRTLPNGTKRTFKAPLASFAARRTVDLPDLQTMLGTEVFPSYNFDGTAGQRIAARELSRVFTGGAVNPRLPPFNCKGDAKRTKGTATTTAGSKVVNDTAAKYLPSDKGKVISLSNAATSEQVLVTTIQDYVSPTQIIMTATAQATRAHEQIWGTDDTVGMQAALDAVQSTNSFIYGGVLQLGVGFYLCGALKYHGRAAINGMGPRISGFMRLPDSTGLPQLSNFSQALDDFPIMFNFGLDGAKYCQTAGSRGFSYLALDSGSTYPQIDPYPFFSHMHIWETSGEGMYLKNRFSGNIVGIDIVGGYGIGLYLDCYDANVVNLLSIANRKAGVDVVSGNNNINNLKCSFNGDQASTSGSGSPIDGCNLRVRSTGNNITNARLQESAASNLLLEGARNTFGDLACDDTGCMRLVHGQGPQTPPDVRAGIHISGSAAVDNVIRSKVSYQVHAVSYATHAIFMSGDAGYNQAELFTPHDMTYNSTGAGTGGAAAGPTGYNSSGGFGATNKVKINGVTAP